MTVRSMALSLRIRSDRVRIAMPPLMVLAVIIGAWYALSYLVLDPSRRFLMPAPHVVISTGLLDPASLQQIGGAMVQTVLVSMIGLAAAVTIGVLWAVAMSQARWIAQSLFPYAVVLQCIPVLALVPLVGFWFGFDLFARVVACVMVALFPMVSNTLFGLQSVDSAHRALFTLQGASRTTILVKLELPTALPAIFAGVRISAGLAVVGAIVADFFFRRGNPGIGNLISNYQSRVQSPQLFAAIGVASLFGVLVFWAFGALSHRIVGRWSDEP